MTAKKTTKKTAKTPPEEALLEACPPRATKFEGADAWYFSGCDGEQAYLWIAYKKRKNAKGYVVREVYPGLLESETRLREAQEEDELIAMDPADPQQRLETMPDILEALEDLMFEDLVFEDEGEDEADEVRAAQK